MTILLEMFQPRGIYKWNVKMNCYKIQSRTLFQEYLMN